MQPEQIIVNALKAEARIRPDTKIHIGMMTFTLKEFVDMLNSRRLSRKERKLVKIHLKTLVNYFNTNETFRARALSLSEE